MSPPPSLTSPSLPAATAPFRWAFTFVRPYLPALAAAFSLTLCGVGFGLAQPWLTRLILDRGLMGGDARLLVGLSAAMIGVGVLSALLSAANRWLYVRASARVLFDLRATLYGHLQTLPPRFFSRRSAGDVLSRLDGDLAEVQRFAVDAPLSAVQSVITLAGAVALMLALDPALTAVAFVLLPAQLAALHATRPWLDRTLRALRDRTADITGFLVQRLSAIRLIQSVDGGRQELARLDRLHGDFLTALLRQQMAGYTAGAVPGLLGSAGTAAVFVWGGLRVIDGDLSVGTLIAFTAYLGRATAPLQSLLGLTVAVQRARIALARVLELLAEAPAVTEPARPQPSRRGAAGLTVTGLSFAHDAGHRPVLHDLALTVPAGAKIGIVGASGAGKSTLVDLICRYYDPDQGGISLDGQDLRQLSLTTVRQRIAVLGQEAPLLPGTIADNLGYGLVQPPDRAALDRAVAAAQLTDWLVSLPQGLDTPVGAWASALSGGQRQRIALARCLLRDPDLLILDEPVAAIDSDAARRLADAVDRLFADRSRIVISHRAEALHGCHALYRLEHGRLTPLPAPAVPAPAMEVPA